ncbi:MAG: lipopolysaccharide biosynthesis protein [Deltaproteobacteria bacterium]|nr:lipopolysaccharide biosynthesis protein [Deltaproteobacteria bacterium]
MRTGSTIILARLLIPEQFGLVGMVTALTGFSETFKDLGLSDATVQQKNITHEQVSTLFWINTSLGVMITLFVVAVSPAIAWFYSEPRLLEVSLVLSLSYLFSGLTVQHQAILRRQMRFVQIGSVHVLSSAIGVALGITMAIRDCGYWALVGMNLSTTIFTAVGTWTICRWRPGYHMSLAKIGSMLRFGRDITGFNIINYFSRNLDNILIGRYCGAGSLGLYDRAYKLMMLPIQQVRVPLASVGMPALSTLQNDPGKFRLYYKKFLSILSFFYMPLVVYLIIYSDVIILLLLGKDWIDAAYIFKILGITAFIQPVSTTRGLVMVSCGKTKKYLISGIANALGMILTFSIGIHWGVTGIAIGYAIANYSMLLPLLYYSFNETPISISLFFKAIALPAFCSMMMGLILIIMANKIQYENALSELVVSLLAAIIIYCTIFLLFPRGRERLIEYCRYPLMVFKRY